MTRLLITLASSVGLILFEGGLTLDLDGYARIDYRLDPDGRIYFLNTEGLTTVVAAAPQFKRLAENQLDDYVIRLGEQANADLLVSAAHLHRGRIATEIAVERDGGVVPIQMEKILD